MSISLPRFIFAVSQEQNLAAFNPDALESFEVRIKGKLKGRDGVEREADYVIIWFKSGRHLLYESGAQVTEAEFHYIIGCLTELVYKSKPELEAEEKAAAQKQLKLWETDNAK